jgi:hypothetical protein
MHTFAKTLGGALLLAFALWAAPVSGPDRPYTLRTLDYTSMLYQYHEMTTGAKRQSYYYPRRDSSWRRGQGASDSSALVVWRGDNAFLAASLVGGLDSRGGKALADTITGYDGGAYLRGYKDSVEFWVDARIFNESHADTFPRSWDREFLEVQKEENNSGVGYTSYARYRGHFSVHTGWARLDFARDVQHWGPGYFNNLTLNQHAVPYNQMSLETQVGPLTVLSLYGDLRVSSQSMSDSNVASRNLYGHRYELDLGNTVLGVSELTVLYDLNKPWLFVPIVPLFMEKGQYSENRNNGSISVDASQRLPWGTRIYSELFIDDFESPISLVKNDNVEAKWAWMGGLQVAHDVARWELGSIAEYARVEPFVYSHFHPSTVQIAHLGEPLGAPAGPNSQTIDWRLYGRYTRKLNLQLHQRWAWKGTDYGSAINDTTMTSGHFKAPKSFLKGAKMQYTVTPALAYEQRYFSLSAEYGFGDDPAFCTRVGLRW